MLDFILPFLYVALELNVLGFTFFIFHAVLRIYIVNYRYYGVLC